MSIVVGYQPGRGGDEAVELGAGLAAALSTDLAIVTAIPKPWFSPAVGRADTEFSTYARRYGDDAEAAARAHLDRRFPQTPAGFHRVSERSVSKSLYKVLGDLHGEILVLGTSHGSTGGRMSFGATTSRLMHSSSIPLALAPKGYTCSQITGITCAYSGDEHGAEVVRSARDLAERMAIRLRVATFGIRPADMFPPELGLEVERTVMDAWREQMGEAMQNLVSKHVIDASTDTVISTGSDWDTAFDAIDWPPGEVIAIGTTPRDPIKRVFLGSRAAKIISAATVPAIIFPG